MSADASLLALTGLGGVTVASGVAALPVRRARASAALMVVSGAGVTAGTLLAATAHDRAAEAVFVLVGALLAPLAVTLYPTARLDHVVDQVAVLLVAGVGLLAALRPWHDLVVSSAGLTLGCVLLAHTWWKLERATGDRRALVWMALAGAVAGMAGFVSGFMQLGTPGEVTSWVVLATLPVAMAIGIRRPEVVDVRGLVVEFAVLATAGTGYVAIFMLAESLIEIVGGETPQPVTLAVVGALAAACFHPMRVMLRGVVDELLFGSRPDPLGAAAKLAEQLGEDPVPALRAIRETLVLPYAALRSRAGTVAESGTPTTHTRTVRLDPEGVTELVVGLRPGDLALTSADRRVLTLVAPLLGQTMRARALAADLQESRGQTVAALEEERRRLRRDLHDGLGPRLSGIAFSADAVRNLVPTDPEAAGQVLRSLRAETATAIEEVRRIVYAMRPPALDELGLLPALRQQAAGLRSRGGRPLEVRLEAAGSLPPLPAAVEVAAYRIVLEALTNVARHTDAAAATARLDAREEGLWLCVLDDCPGTGAWTPGVGVSSMRERAAELGGHLSAGPTPHGGRVEALLPCPPGLSRPAGTPPAAPPRRPRPAAP